MKRTILVATCAVVLALSGQALAQWFITPAGDSMIDDTNNSVNVSVVSGTVSVSLGTNAALADNTANPTTSQIAAFVMGFDGTTWDRVTATASALDVNVKSITSGVGIGVDTDDASVAGAQATAGLMLSLERCFDGTNWLRPIPHDTAINACAPSKLGAVAESSLATITLVADAEMTQLYAGVDGVLITRPHTNLEGIVTGNASNTDGTSTSLIATGGSGVKHYLTSVTCSNAHASTFAYVEIKDGATAKYTLPLPAAGGASISFPTPLPGSADTAWNFDPSAAVTTIYCSAVGFKSKV